MKAHVNIGSNKGNRLPAIDRAVALVASQCVSPGARVHAASPLQSDPWGFDSASPFVNVGIMFDTGMTPVALLDTLSAIERSIDPSPHRDPSGAYIDRVIDIDLIAMDDLVVDTPRLVLPHPRMHLRPFVLIPMLTLDPDWVHPILRLTPRQMLDSL